MSEPTLADITTRANAVDDTSAVLTSYYRSDVLTLLAYVRELRAVLVEVQRCPRCRSCAETADWLLARYPEELAQGGTTP